MSITEQMQDLIWKQFKNGQISEQQGVSALLKEGGLTQAGAIELLRHATSPADRRAEHEAARGQKKFN